ncbi:hypothetical protein [Qipengyuania vesicularis]|uniref:hypothetical protein n=1 Tax=Qipengyuania vesicularis TaxID=2867232 RepID=UPI001C887BB2|nr:hypothetical protein [Qipengyuania vesicularis]MBX7527171.1 hypothetical protein [Qipengyuania vesicularis]
MIARVFAPLCATAVVAGLALLGARTETYDLNVVFHCAYEIARDERPAADILFVGNSQTGASIDPQYMQELLGGEDAPQVEKLAIIRANVVGLRMLIEDYVAQRGAPKLVVIQPMLVRSDRDAQAGRPIHPRDTLVYQDWDELVALQQDAQNSPTGSFLPYWAAKGYRTTATMWIDRQVERITGALSIQRMAKHKRFCAGDRKFQQVGHWPNGTLPLAPGDSAGPVINQSAWDQWRRDMSARNPAPLTDPSRRFELDQNRKILAGLEAAGSKVVLIGYPNLDSAAEDTANYTALSDTLGYEMIDVRSLLTEEERQQIQSLYRDPLHVNFAGAEILSRRLAEDVADRIE